MHQASKLNRSSINAALNVILLQWKIIIIIIIIISIPYVTFVRRQ
jgi:hypothetical protein